MKMYSPSGHPRCRWMCFFFRFWEMCHCITCLPMNPLQWMGAVRMRVQTADKNITIIHTTPVHQLTSGEKKSCVFIKNKYIIKIFLTLRFWSKYKSIIHNNASYSKKKSISCCLSHQNPVTYLFRAVLSCKRCLICADFTPDSDQNTFFTGGSITYYGLWIF